MQYAKQQAQLLKNRSFLFYLCSCIAGTFASGLAYIVTIWMAVDIHASVNTTLIGMTLFWLPSLILGPHFGAIVDRYDRKKLIIFAQSIRILMFMVFGIFIYYQSTLWTIYLLLILSGCFFAFYQPLLPAFVHELVPEKQLLYANANINTSYEIGNIISRGIITVAVLTFLGNSGALFMVAGLYIISTITMLPVQRHHTFKPNPSAQKFNFLKSISSGYLFANKKLLFYACVQAVITLSLMAAPVLVGPYVKIILQASNKVFGISEAAMSIGTVVGAIFWSHLASYISKEICLAIAGALAGCCYLILANTAVINYAIIAFLILGFSWGSFALLMSIVQILTDKNYQGRIQSAISVAVTIIYIFFAIVLGSFDKNYSPQQAFKLLSFSCALVVISIIFARIFLHSTEQKN